MALAHPKAPQRSYYYPTCEPHEKADKILCNLIIDLGFEEIVSIYKSFDKWHA